MSIPCPLLARIEGDLAILTFNRPEKLNALNYDLIDRLMDALAKIENDPTLRAVILTGVGERAFSSGGDIHEFSKTIRESPEAAVRLFARRGQTLTARIEAFAKPVIAAVNRLAYGGGCEILEATHLAIASERALFAKPEINIGIPPTFGGTQRLPRLAGRKRALEHLLTGRPFTAERALEIGLINRIVPHGETVSAAIQLASDILRHSSLTIARILEAATRGLQVSIIEGLNIECDQFARMAATPDAIEALDAWIGRRRTARPA